MIIPTALMATVAASLMRDRVDLLGEGSAPIVSYVPCMIEPEGPVRLLESTFSGMTNYVQLVNVFLPAGTEFSTAELRSIRVIEAADPALVGTSMLYRTSPVNTHAAYRLLQAQSSLTQHGDSS